MSEISKGDLVRFKSGKYVVTTQKKHIEYDLKGEVGMVKTVFDGGAVYEVNILLDDKAYSLKVASSEIEKVCTGVGISEEQATRLIDIMRKIREDIRMHIFCSEMPDPNLWTRSFIEKKPIDVKIEFADILKKWDERLPLRSDFPKLDLRIGKFKLKEEALKQMQELLSERPYVVSKPESAESKMPKARCIKLLESYRAEREKIAKGRKFERCLRDSVVNEALERAIELLKGGSE